MIPCVRFLTSVVIFRSPSQALINCYTSFYVFKITCISYWKLAQEPYFKCFQLVSRSFDPCNMLDSIISGNRWFELSLYQKLWLAPTDLLEFVLFYSHESHSIAVKFVWLAHVILWLNGRVHVFCARGSRFEDGFGCWFLYGFYIVVSL